jgi:hypothetical protein
MTTDFQFVGELLQTPFEPDFQQYAFGSSHIRADLSGLAVCQWYRHRPSVYLEPEHVFRSFSVVLEEIGMADDLEVLLVARHSAASPRITSGDVLTTRRLKARLHTWGVIPYASSDPAIGGRHGFIAGRVPAAALGHVLAAQSTDPAGLLVISRRRQAIGSWLPSAATLLDCTDLIDSGRVAEELRGGDDALVFHSGQTDSVDFSLNVLARESIAASLARRFPSIHARI